MNKRFAIRASSLAFLAAVCATAAARSGYEEDADGSLKLTIVAEDEAKHVIDAIPDDAALEKLTALTADGHSVSYAALAEGDTGGVVFVDGKLRGTLSRKDAEAFYSCRGYVSAVQAHWTKQADEWLAALVSASSPAERVTLRFSGKSNPRSIQEIAGNQNLTGLSIFDISTNPVSLLRKLNSARERMKEKDDYDKAMQSLKSIAPGTKEAELAKTLAPEDMSFGEQSLVLSYPRFAFEFLVREGKVTVAQQPSFYRMAHARPALFYLPDMQWGNCSSVLWRNALTSASVSTTLPK